MRKTIYTVIGVKNGGYNKTDNYPYIQTNNRQKADKALQYCKQQYPEYEWRVTDMFQR